MKEKGTKKLVLFQLRPPRVYNKGLEDWVSPVTTQQQKNIALIQAIIDSGDLKRQIETNLSLSIQCEYILCLPLGLSVWTCYLYFQQEKKGIIYLF